MTLLKKILFNILYTFLALTFFIFIPVFIFIWFSVNNKTIDAETHFIKNKEIYLKYVSNKINEKSKYKIKKVYFYNITKYDNCIEFFLSKNIYDDVIIYCEPEINIKKYQPSISSFYNYSGIKKIENNWFIAHPDWN